MSARRAGGQRYAEYVEDRLPVLRRLAFQLAGDEHRGDSLVQQTITRLYRRWSKAPAQPDLDRYVHGVLIEVFLDDYHQAESGMHLSTTPPGGAAPHHELHQALAETRRTEREALVLRYLDQLSYANNPGPSGPSTVDLPRAITAGRRRRRRQVAGYTTLAAALTLVLAVPIGATLLDRPPFDTANQQTAGAPADPSPPPSAPPPSPTPAAAVAAVDPNAPPPTSCTATEPPDQDATVTGMDPTGRYMVGYVGAEGSTRKTRVWLDGTVVDADVPGAWGALTDINSTGTAVGYTMQGSRSGNGSVAPWIYRNRAVEMLPGVANGTAVAINQAGVVAGTREGPEVVLNGVRWRSSAEPATELKLPTADSLAVAFDIDEDGTIVGAVDKKPYVWLPDGTGQYLKVPPVKFAQGHARSIRNGWVVGQVGGFGRLTGLRWNLRTGEMITTPQFLDSPWAVNARGWMIGQDRAGRPTLIADGKALPLPGFSPAGSGVVEGFPRLISDDGRTIVGALRWKAPSGQADRSGPLPETEKPIVWRCR